MAKILLLMVNRIWSTILEALRLILFVGCLILFALEVTCWILLQLINYVTSHSTSNYDPIGLSQYLVTFMPLITALIGGYASFYKKNFCLKLFTGLILSCLAFHVLYWRNIYNYNEREVVENMVNSLTETMPKYEWDNRENPNDATIVWDRIQSIQCCGVQDYKDWDKYRPSDSIGSYPRSCCPEDLDRCLEKNVYSNGCEKRITSIIEVGSYSFLIWFLQVPLIALLSILGLINLTKNCNCCSSLMSKNFMARLTLGCVRESI